MTDAEKELRRLAKTAAPFSNAGDWLYRILKHNYNTYDERFVAAATPVAVLALLDRIEALENFAEGFAGTADAAIAHAENDGKGMQVPFHGDFAQAKASPSLVRNLRWWARAARDAVGRKS